MRIDIVTIFPEIFSPLDVSIVKNAREKGLIDISIWDLRSFTEDKHRKVDDTPYGGGKGMVLKCQPIFSAVEHIKAINPAAKVLLTTPQGRLLNRGVSAKLSMEDGLIILCGRYEGVDERVLSICDYEISIGDYILTGGELAAMVIVDSLARLIPGVLPEEAVEDDSFTSGLLDWPCYTRPEDFRGMKVPEVLLSGNHRKIEDWRRREAAARTLKRRRDICGDKNPDIR